MTKPLILPFLALFLIAPAALASSLGSGPPAVEVKLARDIAVGAIHVSRVNGLEVRFTPQTVLKGEMQPGSTYIVNYADILNRINYPNVMPQIAAYAEGKPAVMLLGNLQPDGKTLMPAGLDGAVWPRQHEKWPPHQTPDTLEECITFVKALLADPNLKLKQVNDRDVLPDGYSLPPDAAVVPPPENIRDRERVLKYLPPAAAVVSARDIVVGVVRVSREGGLQLQLAVQSVLKGGMQPGGTYSVGYPPARSVYRDDYLPMVAAAVEDKPTVMLLGRLHADGKTFEPEGRDSAVWPRSDKWGGVFQTPDTLEGCITFVKALLANPKLKLKIVNDRQMLPDGYTLPAVPKAP